MYQSKPKCISIITNKGVFLHLNFQWSTSQRTTTYLLRELYIGHLSDFCVDFMHIAEWLNTHSYCHVLHQSETLIVILVYFTTLMRIMGKSNVNLECTL